MYLLDLKKEECMHYFDKHVKEINTYLKELSFELGHENDTEQTVRLLRAVLHTIRDRITIPESIDLLAQLPMMLKAIYVEQWSCHEKPPLSFDDIEGFTEAVKNKQAQFGERKFDWNESTEELAMIVISSLRKYITDGQAIHVMDQMPKEVKELF